jgi:hypothetical protein
MADVVMKTNFRIEKYSTSLKESVRVLRIDNNKKKN